MTQHVGIVACSAEGAALCYRTICVEGAESLGPHNHPEVTMHTHPLAAYHNALPYVIPQSPLPWLHIADEVATHAVQRGFHRIGITGTRWLTASEVYPEKFAARGLTYVRPSPEEVEEINRIIMDELVYGIFKPEAIAYFQKVIGGMKEKGCNAVVLGCTEIPLIMNDGNSPLPVLDSTRLLARAALRRAATEAATPSAVQGRG